MSLCVKEDAVEFDGRNDTVENVFTGVLLQWLPGSYERMNDRLTYLSVMADEKFNVDTL